uniref:Uncharacterized protein n=1 Tax=Anguilla anguilla TaxID=7936 RepID=A0A0E9TH27_ANGAN
MPSGIWKWLTMTLSTYERKPYGKTRIEV